VGAVVERITRVEDAVKSVAGADAPLRWMIASRSPVQERVDDVQDKLACVIGNAELLLEMVEGPARERVAAILRGAWRASCLVDALPLSTAVRAPSPN
jgi:hypothetical protein